MATLDFLDHKSCMPPNGALTLLSRQGIQLQFEYK